MTKKHYIELAADLKRLREVYAYTAEHNTKPSPQVQGIDLAIDVLVGVLERANSHFDKQRFLTACGR